MKAILSVAFVIMGALALNMAMPSPKEVYNDDLADVEVRCLTQAMYFEAATEPELGQRAVAEVILNRRDSGEYPNFVCDVVTQKGQFSWFHGWPMKPGNMDVWWHIYGIAQDEMNKRQIGHEVVNQIIPRDYLYFCSGDCVRHCSGIVIANQCYYRSHS